jgi:hypothetical protein
MSQCDHSTIGAPDVVEFFPCCHRYKRGDRFLPSVSRVIGIWPEKPSWDNGDERTLRNVERARERGQITDSLLCQWIAGGPVEIPVGSIDDAEVHAESIALFHKLANWWPAVFRGIEVETQVILNDGEIAGMADLVPPDEVWDLKCVSELQPTYTLQIGGYCHLYEAQYGRTPKRCGNIHVNKTMKKPKLVEYEPIIVMSEFRTVLEMWRLFQRKTKKKTA